MRRRFLLMLPLLLTGLLPAAWLKRHVGWAPDVLNLMQVGDGRNDGRERVYAVCEDGHIYEWTWAADTWLRADLGEAPGSGWALGLSLGPGRNDGRNRLYMTRVNGHAYEFFYDPGSDSWLITDLGSPSPSLYGITVAKGRNDDTSRLYCSGDGVPTVEYTWTGSRWRQDTVQPGPAQQWVVEAGPGRNDETTRVYAPNSLGLTRTVAEYTWDGSGFIRADLPPVGGNPLAIAIGPGRNDGISRVYASSRAKAYEFTWNGNAWQTLDILPSFPAEPRYDIVLARLRADNRVRAYVSCSGDQLIETGWQDSVWADSAIDATTGATCGIAAGAGRNDDTLRLYGCNRYGEVNEFTHSDPLVAVAGPAPAAPPSRLLARPAPATGPITFELNLTRPARVELLVQDILGRTIAVPLRANLPAGRHCAAWAGLDRTGARVPAGVYLCCLRSAGQPEYRTLVITD